MPDCTCRRGEAEVQGAQVFRVETELNNPQETAKRYQKALQENIKNTNEGQAVFDLILLGMGDDGHTASLFPNTEALNEDKLAIVANFVEKLDTWRITLTYPLIKQARKIVFLEKTPVFP